ncbi:MAG TPA: hypothetical protein V6D10_18710 [Trichocoleus sp.]
MQAEKLPYLKPAFNTVQFWISKAAIDFILELRRYSQLKRAIPFTHHLSHRLAHP